MNHELYQSFTAALLTVGALVLFALLAAPVAEPFAWALIIGISTIPHYNRLAQRMPRHPNLSAGVMVLVVTLCVVLPLSLLAFAVAKNATEWYQQAAQLTGSMKTGGGFLRQFPLVDKLLALGSRFGLDLSGIGSKLAAGASQFLLEAARDLAKNLANLLFVLVLALFILFFVYRDGERLVAEAIRRFAGDRTRASRMVADFRSTVTSVTVGTLFTCMAQGVTAGIGYFFADVPAPFLFGALTAIAALLPVVGTGFVWIPVVVLVAVKGSYVTAGLLALWCVFMVGLADNAIRPLAIGATSDIPVISIVLGAICGVFTLGLLGLILGPVLFALLGTLWKEIVQNGGSPAEKEPVDPSEGT